MAGHGRARQDARRSCAQFTAIPTRVPVHPFLDAARGRRKRNSPSFRTKPTTIFLCSKPLPPFPNPPSARVNYHRAPQGSPGHTIKFHSGLLPDQPKNGTGRPRPVQAQSGWQQGFERWTLAASRTGRPLPIVAGLTAVAVYSKTTARWLQSRAMQFLS